MPQVTLQAHSSEACHIWHSLKRVGSPSAKSSRQERETQVREGSRHSRQLIAAVTLRRRLCKPTCLSNGFNPTTSGAMIRAKIQASSCVTLDQSHLRSEVASAAGVLPTPCTVALDVLREAASRLALVRAMCTEIGISLLVRTDFSMYSVLREQNQKSNTHVSWTIPKVRHTTRLLEGSRNFRLRTCCSHGGSPSASTASATATRCGSERRLFNRRISYSTKAW